VWQAGAFAKLWAGTNDASPKNIKLLEDRQEC
jgi:hypothetical protein